MVNKDITETGIVYVKENGDIVCQSHSEKKFLSFCKNEKVIKKDIDEEGALLLNSNMLLAGTLNSLNEGKEVKHSDKDWNWDGENKIMFVPLMNKEKLEELKDSFFIYKMSWK